MNKHKVLFEDIYISISKVMHKSYVLLYLAGEVNKEGFFKNTSQEELDRLINAAPDYLKSLAIKKDKNLIKSCIMAIDLIEELFPQKMLDEIWLISASDEDCCEMD